MKRISALLGSITLGIALTLGLVWGLLAMSAKEARADDGVWAQATQQEIAISNALAWLCTQQNNDGSIGTYTGATIDAVLALVAAKEDPNTWAKNGNSPLDYLASQASTYATGPAAAGKLALAVTAANQDPYNFGGENLIAKIHGWYNPATGHFTSTAGSGSSLDQAYSLMALAAAFEPITPLAKTRLESIQTITGYWCWDYTSDCGGDYSTSAQVMEALIAVGEPITSMAMVSATKWLSDTQIASGTYAGAWPSAGTSPKAYDTGPVIMALIAGGESPISITWTRQTTTALAALLAMQNPNGAFPGWFGDDVSTTAWAISAVMGRPDPQWGRIMGARKGLEYLKSTQGADGGWGSAGTACDAVFAIVAYGDDPTSDSWKSTGGKTPLDYLETQADAYSQVSADAAGKLIVAAIAARYPPEFLGGVNLYDRLQSFYNSGTGFYGSNVSAQAWAILALKAMRKPIPLEAVNYLRSLAEDATENKTWEFWGDRSYGISFALMALRAAGYDDPATSFWFEDAYDYLRDNIQDDGGGFPQTNEPPIWWLAMGDPDSTSTSYNLMGLVAGDRDPMAWKWTKQIPGEVTVNDPIYWLLGMQFRSHESNAKAFRVREAADIYDDYRMSTAQAIPGLMLQRFPLNEPTLISVTTKPITGYQSSCNEVLVIAPFEEDADGDATASLQWNVDGGALQGPQAMARNSNSFSTTIPAVGSSYVLTVTYSDPDGVSGTNPQPQTISMNINQTWAYTITAQQVCTSTVVTATFCGDANANLGGTATHTSSGTPVISGATAMVHGSGILTANIPITRTDTYTVEVLYQDTDGVVGDALQSVTVTMELPMADFIVSPSSPISGTVTQFTDASEGGSTAWQWDFGDGSPITTTQNPTHTYVITGPVTVHQTVTFGTCGTLVVTKTITVTEGTRLYLPMVMKEYTGTTP